MLYLNAKCSKFTWIESNGKPNSKNGDRCLCVHSSECAFIICVFVPVNEWDFFYLIIPHHFSVCTGDVFSVFNWKLGIDAIKNRKKMCARHRATSLKCKTIWTFNFWFGWSCWPSEHHVWSWDIRKTGKNSPLTIFLFLQFGQITFFFIVTPSQNKWFCIHQKSTGERILISRADRIFVDQPFNIDTKLLTESNPCEIIRISYMFTETPFSQLVLCILITITVGHLMLIKAMDRPATLTITITIEAFCLQSAGLYNYCSLG